MCCCRCRRASAAPGRDLQSLAEGAHEEEEEAEPPVAPVRIALSAAGRWAVLVRVTRRIRRLRRIWGLLGQGLRAYSGLRWGPSLSRQSRR